MGTLTPQERQEKGTGRAQEHNRVRRGEKLGNELTKGYFVDRQAARRSLPTISCV